MCDISEEEYAEYLRWVEAAVAEPAVPRPRVRRAPAGTLSVPVIDPALASA